MTVAITETVIVTASVIASIATAMATAFQIARIAARTIRGATDCKQAGTRACTSASRTGLQHRYSPH